MLLDAGVGDVCVADSQGIVHRDRAGLNDVKRELAGRTNRLGLKGPIEEALVGAHAFVGVSAGEVAEPAIASMAENAIVFALANPHPEVHPEVARRYAAVVATGRSDFPNQINNVLAFPGVFRGALDVRASRITPRMRVAAAEAIAAVARRDGLAPDFIVPSPFNPRVAVEVAARVAAAARADGVARA
jgi:malate dehydrogenase (oxaloacetate-decarboxylating)